MTSWSLEPLMGSWVLVAVVAIVLLAGLWIRPQFASLNPGRRRVLFGLRLVLVLLVLLAMLRPGIVWSQMKSQRAVIAVLMDYSASQQLPSGTSGLSRWKLQQDYWKKLKLVGDQVADDIDILPFSYDEQLRPLTVDSGKELTFSEQPTGRVTDIGRALAELSTTRTEFPLAGVVLLGDGTITAENSKYDPVQISRQFGQMDQPIIVAGTGPRAGSDDSRDVAIEGVAEELEVFTRNRVEVKGTLRLRGLVGSTVPLKISLIGADGKASIIDTQNIVPREPDEVLPFTIPLIAPDPGEYRLLAEVASQPGEAITSNNIATTFMSVKSGGVRILYLEGQPRQEQVFLRRSINASPDIQLDFLIIPPNTRNRWPIDLKGVLAGSEYDAFIIGDLDSSAFGREQLEVLKQRVEDGAGLMLLGGFHAYDGGGYGSSPLADVLPMQLRPGMQQPFGQPVLPQLHWDGMLKLKPVGIHPVTQLGEGEKNAELWNRLKPLEGANRWLNIKQAPGIQVIATDEETRPVLVASSVGRGRVLAMAGDSTWRWWLSGEQQIHKQFWRQSLLWVLGRDRIEEGISLVLEQRRLYKDQSVDFQVRWRPGTGQQEIPAGIEVEVIKPDGSSEKISTTKRDAETLVGTWRVGGESGVYKLKATVNRAPGGPDDKANLTSELPFLVMDNSIELANPIPDWQLFGQIADNTKEAGGSLVDGEELPEALLTLVRRLQSQETKVEQARRLGDKASDQWIYLGLFALLLTGEWWLRKKWQMA